MTYTHSIVWASVGQMPQQKRHHEKTKHYWSATEKEAAQNLLQITTSS